jgi:ankyrin repeat protein
VGVLNGHWSSADYAHLVMTCSRIQQAVHLPNGLLHTVFAYALVEGRYDIIEPYVDRPALQQCLTTKEAFHCFRVAVYRGHLETLYKLMQRLPWLLMTHSSEWYQTVLFSASLEGHLELMDLLLSKGSGDPTGGEILRWTVAKGQVTSVARLLEDSRINPASSDNEAICCAGENGYDQIVKLLLKDPRVDPKADQYRALLFACSRGYDRVVELLIKDHRIGNPRVWLDRALEWAYKEQRESVIKLLMSQMNPKGEVMSHATCHRPTDVKEIVEQFQRLHYQE